MSNPSRILLIWAVILLAANLRAPIIVLGPIVETVRLALGSSDTVMGLIGSFPVLVFALCAPFAAPLASRFGIERVIVAALVLIGGGCLLRSLWPSVWLILLGTVLFSAGISMGNVLLAAFIKRRAQQYIEQVTALQMIVMGTTAAASAALAVPLARGFGWQVALGVWGILAIPAIIVWARLDAGEAHPDSQPTPAVPKPLASRRIWASPLAWKISLYFGLQSMMFYTFVSWLAMIFIARGVSEDVAGWYNTIFQLISLPVVFALGYFSTQVRRSQSILLPLSAAVTLLGLILAWTLPTPLLALAAIILGAGGGASFTLCLMLFAQRGETVAESAALSGMAQTIGYLLAAIGPLGCGWLKDLSGGLTLPVMVMMVVLALQSLSGVFAGKPGKL